MKTQHATPTDTDRELTPLDSTHVAAADVPTRVRLAPWGMVESAAGEFVVDAESARLAIEAFDTHGTDLPIDYEHQTLGGPYASPTGQAPAAGWVKRLEAEPEVGLFALVEWTKPALEQLAAKQYRYLSPVALVRKHDRKLIGLHSVALTNKPAIVGMEPIVNRCSSPDQLGPMDAHRDLCERLSLPVESSVDTVLVAARELIDRSEKNRTLRDAEEKVKDALRSGKVVEAQHDFAIRLALRDTSLFDEWLRTAPVVMPLGRIAPRFDRTGGERRHGLAANARAEYRAHPELAALTSEDAFVADRLRRAD